MLGCRYDATAAERPLLLELARANGITTSLVIPRSALDYHRAVFPGFAFDHEDVVPDPRGGRVPTAGEVVERSLAWLRERRPERFLLWAYQFDVHGWADLDDGDVEREARQAGLPPKGLPLPYLVAARGVDRAFARLRAGLAELGVADRTVVVFVSDHGEALGEQSFWTHTTYLWESLIRVPFAIDVPGRDPGARADPVSTVDLVPTLAPFLGPVPPRTRCHGTQLFEAEPRRRTAVQFSAMVDGALVRIGMLRGADRKLVFDLRDAEARLLRIDDASGRELDVSATEVDERATAVSELVRGPLYARSVGRRR